MRKRRSNDPAQLRLGFPPDLSAKLIDCWRQLKARYPDPLLLVADSGYYLCLDQDAETIHRLTGQQLEPASIPYMVIVIDNASTWFEPIVTIGLSLLICDPPHDPSRFVFT